MHTEIALLQGVYLCSPGLTFYFLSFLLLLLLLLLHLLLILLPLIVLPGVGPGVPGHPALYIKSLFRALVFLFR